MPFFYGPSESNGTNSASQLQSSALWATALVFGTALSCYICLRLTRHAIVARRREEAMVVIAQRAQIDAEAAAAAAAAVAAANGVGSGNTNRRRQQQQHQNRLSRSMIARLPTFDYVDPPSGQESDGDGIDDDGGFDFEGEEGDKERLREKLGGGAATATTAATTTAAATTSGEDVDVEKGSIAPGAATATTSAAAAPAPAPTKKSLPRSSSSKKRRCIVCLDPLSSERVMALPCGHLFHESCVEEWLERHGNCPECRMEITPALLAALADEGGLEEEELMMLERGGGAGGVAAAANNNNAATAAVGNLDVEQGAVEEANNNVESSSSRRSSNRRHHQRSHRNRRR